MWPEGQLVDVVAEIEQLMVEVLLHPELHVPVPARRDVEVALHLVALERAVDAAAVDRRPPRQFRRLLEFLVLVLAHVAQHMPNMRVFLLRLLALCVTLVQARVHPALHFAEAKQFPGIEPEFKVGFLFREQVAGHDAVHGRVLDVDVQVFARHGDHDVEVQLQFVANAALDAEVVGFGAGVPGS